MHGLWTGKTSNYKDIWLRKWDQAVVLGGRLNHSHVQTMWAPAARYSPRCWVTCGFPDISEMGGGGAHFSGDVIQIHGFSIEKHIEFEGDRQQHIQNKKNTLT